MLCHILTIWPSYGQIGTSRTSITARWVLHRFSWTCTHSKPILSLESESDKTRDRRCRVLMIWPHFGQTGTSRTSITTWWVLHCPSWTCTHSESILALESESNKMRDMHHHVLVIQSYYGHIGFGTSRSSITARWVPDWLSWTWAYSRPILALESGSNVTREMHCHFLMIQLVYAWITVLLRL